MKRYAFSSRQKLIMVLGFFWQININDIWLELIRICSGAILKCWYGWILSNVDYTYYISLWFKETRQRGRFAGFSLFISKSSTKENFTQCYKDGPLLPPLNFTATCVKQGRYVTFYNERIDWVHYPEGYQINAVYTELCEVIVEGNKLWPPPVKKRKKEKKSKYMYILNCNDNYIEFWYL